jgi:hypothetical protein
VVGGRGAVVNGGFTALVVAVSPASSGCGQEVLYA